MELLYTLEQFFGTKFNSKSPKTPNLENDYSKKIITKLHDKYYDLTTFKHPGGPIQIALIDKRDGTELFESHHLFTKTDLQSMLKKYEIRDPGLEIQSSNVYNWEKTKSSPFVKELHEMARKELGNDIKITWFRLFEIFLIFLLAASQCYFYTQGKWFTLLSMPLGVWLLAVNTFHDASHFALSWNWKLNRLGTNFGFMFSAPYTWYHQHVIGHHSFPNIPGKDPDLYHAPKIIRHSKDVRHRVAHTYQTLTFFITWFLGVPFSIIWHGMKQALSKKSYNRVVTFGHNKYLNTYTLVLRFLFYFALTYLLPFYLHGATIKAVLFSVVPIYLFSFCFMLSSQINHLTPHTTDQLDENFFIHQILTSHDVAVDNYLVFLFTGGLNIQIEHHLFPSINHCHLRKLAPKVREICKKHGIKLTESMSLWEAVCQHVRHLRNYCVE